MNETKLSRPVRAPVSPARPNSQMAQLLAAVSILSVSLGLSPVHAASCAAGQQCDAAQSGTNPMIGQYTRKKLPGRMKSGTLTVTRSAPMSTTTDLNNWSAGSGAPKTDKATSGNAHQGSMSGNHKDVMEATAPAPGGGNGGTMTEKVTLHHEGLYTSAPHGPAGQSGTGNPQ